MTDIFLRVTQEGIRANHPDGLPVILVLPERSTHTELGALLELKEVAGVVIPMSEGAVSTQDPRIGYFLDYGGWTLPKVGARGIIVLTRINMLGIRKVLMALQEGIQYSLHLNLCGHWQRQSLWAMAWHRAVGLLMMTWLQPQKKIIEGKLRNKLYDLPAPVDPPTGKPSVLLINSSLGAGGAERQVLNTARGLIQRGHDLQVVCQSLGTEQYDFHRKFLEPYTEPRTLKEIVEVVGSTSEDSLKHFREYMESSRIRDIEELLSPQVAETVAVFLTEYFQSRPSIVHLWQDTTNVLGGVAAVLAGIPNIVLGMRNLAPFRFGYYQPYMRPIYRFLSDHPNVVMVNNSHAGAEDYANWLGIPGDKIQVLRNGIDDSMPSLEPEQIAEWRNQVDIPQDSLVVGGIFRFWPEKDPLLWVNVAAKILTKRSNIFFLLVGDGPMRADIERCAEDLGIQNNLRLMGIVSDVRLPHSVMDVSLLTSKAEGTPNVLLEAQLMGIPVVTTEAGGAAETVDDGITGMVVTSRDSQDIAECVLDVLEQSQWRLQVQTAGPAFVRTRFGMARMLDETSALYGLPHS